jgi:hypothetical protein
VDVLDARNIPGIETPHDQDGRLGNAESCSAAEDREQGAFGEELAYQPLPSSAQGGADGDLLVASGGAREQQVGDVGAGDQQNQRDGAEQHQQGAADIADHVLPQADQVHAERLAQNIAQYDAYEILTPNYDHSKRDTT